MKLTSYICPVCGYDEMQEPPEDYTICPSCGTEFGYDDELLSYDALRARWLASGGNWWSENTPRPEHWDPMIQVARVERSLTATGAISSEYVSLGDVGKALVVGPVTQSAVRAVLAAA